MKRISVLLISSLIILFSALSAFASEAVSFSCSDVECDNNRLFYLEVKAKSSDPISAATFEFTYDKTMLEFRGVSTDDDSVVRANELDDSVMAVYLCSSGKNIASEATLFRIQFKAIKSGSCYIDYTVSDCVDKSVENMPVGSCSAALVTVNGSSNSASSGSVSSKASSNDTDKSDDGKYTGKTSENKADALATYDEFGFLNGNISDNSTLMFAVGIICGVVLIALILTAFFAGKHIAEKKNSDNSDHK